MSDLREQVARKIAARLGQDFDALPANRAMRLQYIRSGGSPSDHTKDDCLNAADDILEMAEVKDVLRRRVMPRKHPELAVIGL